MNSERIQNLIKNVNPPPPPSGRLSVPSGSVLLLLLVFLAFMALSLGRSLHATLTDFSSCLPMMQTSRRLQYWSSARRYFSAACGCRFDRNRSACCVLAGATTPPISMQGFGKTRLFRVTWMTLCWRRNALTPRSPCRGLEKRVFFASLG